MDRRILREKAKIEYKRLMKGVPRAKRRPFSEIYKMVAATLGMKDAGEKVAKDRAELSGLEDMVLDAPDEITSIE